MGGGAAPGTVTAHRRHRVPARHLPVVRVNVVLAGHHMSQAAVQAAAVCALDTAERRCRPARPPLTRAGAARASPAQPHIDRHVPQRSLEMVRDAFARVAVPDPMRVHAAVVYISRHAIHCTSQWLTCIRGAGSRSMSNESLLLDALAARLGRHLHVGPCTHSHRHTAVQIHRGGAMDADGLRRQLGAFVDAHVIIGAQASCCLNDRRADPLPLGQAGTGPG